MYKTSIKARIKDIENVNVRNLLKEYVECLEKLEAEDITIHDKKILEELKLPVELKSNPASDGFHENLIIWQNIFDTELPKDTKLTLTHVKNMVLSFISSANPPIKPSGDSSEIPLPLKQSALNVYLEDENFQNQLNALAENNISAFELLSNIFDQNSSQEGLAQNYFYGYDLSETQSLFEQEN